MLFVFFIAHLLDLVVYTHILILLKRGNNVQCIRASLYVKCLITFLSICTSGRSS